MPILTPSQWQSLARQKTFSNTFNNSIGDTTDAGLLSDNNYTNGNIDMDAKAKSNLDENMTSKDDDDFCKKNFKINIEKLFQ